MPVPALQTRTRGVIPVLPAEERRLRLRSQTDRGQTEAEATSGLVAYLSGEPVGWCAVEPRVSFTGLTRFYRVPWEGRTEDKRDPDVWAITCFFTRAGYRKRGVSKALARAAVQHARDRSARALERCPITTSNAIAEELHVGTEATFLQAEFSEVSRPTKRRAVMRIDF